MNPASNNFSTSSRMTFCLFGWNRLTFCWISFKVTNTLSRWEATFGCIPAMSEWVQVNMFWFYWSTFWSSSLSVGRRRVLTYVKRLSSPEIRMVSNGSAVEGSLSVGCCNWYWLEEFAFFGTVLVDGAGSCFASDLITLPDGELASVKIDLPIPGDEAGGTWTGWLLYHVATCVPRWH